MALETFFFFLLLSFRQLSCGSFHPHPQFSFCTGTICPDLEVAALSLSEFYFWIIGYLEFFFLSLSFHSTSARLAARLTAGSPKCFFFLFFFLPAVQSAEISESLLSPFIKVTLGLTQREQRSCGLLWPRRAHKLSFP